LISSPELATRHSLHEANLRVSPLNLTSPLTSPRGEFSSEPVEPLPLAIFIFAEASDAGKPRWNPRQLVEETKFRGKRAFSFGAHRGPLLNIALPIIKETGSEIGRCRSRGIEKDELIWMVTKANDTLNR